MEVYHRIHPFTRPATAPRRAGAATDAKRASKMASRTPLMASQRGPGSEGSHTFEAHRNGPEDYLPGVRNICRQCCYGNRRRSLLLEEQSGRITIRTKKPGMTYEEDFEQVSVGWAKNVISVTVCTESPALSATFALVLIAVILGETMIGLGFVFGGPLGNIEGRERWAFRAPPVSLHAGLPAPTLRF